MLGSAEAAARVVVEHLASLPDMAAVDLAGALEAATAIREPAPEGGTPLRELLHAVEAGARKSFTTAGPGYLAYIPGGGLWSAALADFVAAALNRYVGVWEAAPVLAQIEALAVRWMADLFGFPAEARGSSPPAGRCRTSPRWSRPAARCSASGSRTALCMPRTRSTIRW